jgi:ubiquinone/menaquinone biosynthesis C-methylase UbiE
MGFGHFGFRSQAGMTTAPTEAAVIHDDGASYELFMGPWSRAAGAKFLDWLAPPRRARWLDIGCGTGAFTELILRTCAPLSIDGVDTQLAQIAWAKRRCRDDRVTFRMGDAHQLPFEDQTFDIVASALVLNFLVDRSRALDEMRRVAKPGATVAAYIWDFATDRTPNSWLLDGLRRLGVEVPPIVGTAGSRLPTLTQLFHQTGCRDVVSTVFNVTVAFSTFEELWQSQTPSFSPTTKIIAALAACERNKLIETVRERTLSPDGGASWSARAHAIKARTR